MNIENLKQELFKELSDENKLRAKGTSEKDIKILNDLATMINSNDKYIYALLDLMKKHNIA